MEDKDCVPDVNNHVTFLSCQQIKQIKIQDVASSTSWMLEDDNFILIDFANKLTLGRQIVNITIFKIKSLRTFLEFTFFLLLLLPFTVIMIYSSLSRRYRCIVGMSEQSVYIRLILKKKIKNNC